MTSPILSRRPLRIVIGAVTFPPDVNGAAVFAQRLARGLAAHGHEVHVVCHSPTSFSTQESADGITVHRVGSYATGVHGTIRMMSPWKASREAGRLLDEIRPDVVHVQSHFYITRGLVNAARARGIGLIATNHFMPENLFGYLKVPRMLQGLATKLLWSNLVRHYSKAEIVTAPTPRAVNLLQENGFAKRAMALSCGIDVQRYATPARRYRAQHPDRETRNVLFVGRLDEEKHIDDLLRATAVLRETVPLRLEIVGEGSRRAAFEQLADELGIADLVHFAGFVSDDELLDAYARADLFVMPSIAELQSIATLEAMSAGTPVVLANAMALPHLVHEGENGVLYPPRDVHALARAMGEILRDRTVIERMGVAGERLVYQHDISVVLDRFESLYRHVIDPEESAQPAEIYTGLAS
ncbi:glycosyltransferase [Allosaccharopolyspora coralli]|uniref:Glycosyltransferase n=1 Tax=Allosaccharopolyspora coralli TaxID=2665642 RepID=A0A5Q3Q466_9PSEU|nr:glycosyltransferase [Allosaccharopolyspora coralli]QGK68620.1 glycosyltransferase [Allosaccharopolyspora coralli]